MPRSYFYLRKLTFLFILSLIRLGWLIVRIQQELTSDKNAVILTLPPGTYYWRVRARKSATEWGIEVKSTISP